MALTKKEKELLDNEVLAYLQDIERNYDDKHYISYYKIMCNVSIRCTTTSIVYSIERLFKKNLIVKNHFIDSYNGLTYSPKNYIQYNLREINYIKNKNIVTFKVGEKKLFNYDFISSKFDINIDECEFLNNSVESFFKEVLSSKYEWFFNYYVGSLQTIKDIIKNYPTEALKMPSGLFELIKENHNYITEQIFKEFIAKEKFGKYYKYAISIGLMDFTKDEITKIYKIHCLSMLNGEYQISYLIEKYRKTKLLKIEYILDINRSLYYNIDQMNNLIDKEKNELLAKQLQRLNFIHNRQFSDYTVVVPQTQQDKIDEGRMQNNCVGHYYDDSIINGANLIFFLRKTNNKNKSYITCRYNIACAEVTEARKKNNMSINNTYEESLIKEIGKIIKDNLK